MGKKKGKAEQFFSVGLLILIFDSLGRTATNFSPNLKGKF